VSRLYKTRHYFSLMKLLLSLLLLLFNIFSNAQDSTSPYRKDFNFFWTTLKTDYCYWDKKSIDWDKVKEIYAAQFDTITSKENFILLMEKVFNEFYDHHASLGSNVRSSQRLVPSGTDLWAKYINNKPVITEVRLGFGAYKAGMTPGMEIVAVNDVPVQTAIKKFLPASFTNRDEEAMNYALRVLIAGKAVDDRKITVRYKGETKTFFPDRPAPLLREFKYDGEIDSKILQGNIGYIRLNNNLGDNDLIHLFDSVLTSLAKTNALVLDLRETPGGGNTTVARAIIGSFIKKEGFYQKHELTAEERAYGIKRSWEEIVSPRKNIYTKPLVILVDHWTGSVSEGIVIGFDALKRGTIIGTEMAQLNGAVYSYQLPETKIWFNIPLEKLFHVNGNPREKFKPNIVVDVSKQKNGEDLILTTALRYLEKIREKNK
jgi:C-terminal processing protease CtpA/Prc